MSKEAAIAKQPVKESEDLGIPVEIAFLQAGTQLPGGRLETTLSTHRVPGIKMYWQKQEGLLVDIGGKRGLIPSANFKIVHFK